jgi:hypothetical protein
MASLPIYFESRRVGNVDVDRTGPGFTYDARWIGLRGAFGMPAGRMRYAFNSRTREVVRVSKRYGIFDGGFKRLSQLLRRWP